MSIKFSLGGGQTLALVEEDEQKISGQQFLFFTWKMELHYPECTADSLATTSDTKGGATSVHPTHSSSAFEANRAKE
jgi:hypothetical protein